MVWCSGVQHFVMLVTLSIQHFLCESKFIWNWMWQVDWIVGQLLCVYCFSQLDYFFFILYI
uniref:Uncharacterized protein n=1 Tax=Arundo donax TaxID=35708 RepID=A0A0A9BRW7_ARUDO